MTTPTLTPSKVQKAMDKLIAMSADEIDIPVTPSTVMISEVECRAILSVTLYRHYCSDEEMEVFDNLQNRILALLEGK